MKVAVWDTYVTDRSGGVMHFDILVPEELKETRIIFGYGQQYLATKGQQGQQLDASECKRCHIEEASADMISSINDKGYYIIEMEGCNPDKQQFTSKDFHQTFARPVFVKPSHLVHRNVEKTGEHNQFSTERKHPVFFVDLPSKNVSITLGGLLPDQLTNRHRHTYETLLYVLEGDGWTEIEGERVEWQAGDAVYIPSWAWHRHQNVNNKKPARYLACENAPQLQNLGVALREEEGRDL